MPGWPGASLSSSDRVLLRHLQRRALRYFLDNQAPCGLVLDRQSNHGPARDGDTLSISATGMGLIAIALASASPYRLIDERQAIARVRKSLETGLNTIPTDQGIMPHFVDRDGLLAVGEDAFSTV